ncbi:hypothetical protein EDEG_01482 [Edhazardia aedis USNM 41457]|uniref:Uncharacterized protein n=1 Tax=Edhazardia aedis (strain USNM 41457) TaxID=1003232 RepID=J9DNX6_EDHAE|nr:hypothetical protein EDEG_01482 [Edhazardia aedis USNM 41457]|eukprot:EJW04250.1 hypothetical protein EDEG_01482 [Edhazardia aedis USNM 41457]
MCYHMGIGCATDEAVKSKNWEKVRKHSENYMKEFVKKRRRIKKFENNDRVLIKNHLRKTKNDEIFLKKGKIVKNEYGDVYEVLKDRKLIKRHASQLRWCSKGEVGNDDCI